MQRIPDERFVASPVMGHEECIGRWLEHADIEQIDEDRKRKVEMAARPEARDHEREDEIEGHLRGNRPIARHDAVNAVRPESVQKYGGQHHLKRANSMGRVMAWAGAV